MELLDMPAPWYSTTLGDAELIVLDANRPTDPEQVAWLEQTLQASRAPWKIAVFHQPAFSCSTHATTPEVVAAWVPLFEAHGVDLVLNGHDHNYQRFEPRHDVTYIVSGGGGARLYEIEACEHGEPPLAAGNDDAHSFIAVEGSHTRLHLQAISENGDILDEIALTR
jgi:hypothetical protein